MEHSAAWDTKEKVKGLKNQEVFTAMMAALD